MLSYVPPIFPPSRRAADLIVRVQQVASGHERRQFVGVAHQLYRGDRRWMPPFNAARKDALHPERNPLLQDADLRAFLGVAQNLGLGGETVATLAAWTAAGGSEQEGGAWGSWGLFEAINVEDLADRLFYEAENWLFENAAGLVGIHGPMSIEPLVPPGLLTDGFDAHPAAFLPYNTPYYPEMIEGQGYEPGNSWRAYSMDLSLSSHAQGRVGALPPVTTDTWREVSRAYASAATAGPTGMAIPGLFHWLDHLAGAARFPFNAEWVRAVGRAFRSALVSGLEDAIEGPAVCFGVPDIGDALRLSRGRRFPLGWLLFGIGLRRTRRLRIFPAAAPEIWAGDQLSELYAKIAQAAASAGYRHIDIAPIADDDERSVAALSALGARSTQQFTIYEKVV